MAEAPKEMSFWQSLSATFLDKDGSLDNAEIVATYAAIVGLTCPVIDWIRSGGNFPVVAYASAASGFIVAIGAAKRIKDGLWKKEDEEHHE